MRCRALCVVLLCSARGACSATFAARARARSAARARRNPTLVAAPAWTAARGRPSMCMDSRCARSVPLPLLSLIFSVSVVLPRLASQLAPVRWCCCWSAELHAGFGGREQGPSVVRQLRRRSVLRRRPAVQGVNASAPGLTRFAVSLARHLAALRSWPFRVGRRVFLVHGLRARPLHAADRRSLVPSESLVRISTDFFAVSRL